MSPKLQELQEFQETVWRYYDQHGRSLPWREPDGAGRFDPYKIMISEIMLQQTQVGRVIPKYHAFLEVFPTVTQLATVGLGEVLVQWSGLGYNRRAKFLWQAAKVVVDTYRGKMPETVGELVNLPGVGRNTAAAIVVYAYDKPEVFVETNIRTVYIHHFFKDGWDVHDKDILRLVSATLPTEHHREWYWALMDYGTYLKATVGNLNKASRHYAKQSAFAGSRRQLRGQVLRALAAGPQTAERLKQSIVDNRLDEVLDQLLQERMIRFTRGKYSL